MRSVRYSGSAPTSPSPKLWLLCFPSTVLVSAGTQDKVGSFSRRAFSHDLRPKGNDYLSVFYREAQGSCEHLTEQSYPRCSAYGGKHSTSLELQLSSDSIGTLSCDQPHTLLTPAHVGGRQFATALFPWVLAHKDIPLSPKSKALL